MVHTHIDMDTTRGMGELIVMYTGVNFCSFSGNCLLTVRTGSPAKNLSFTHGLAGFQLDYVFLFFT